MYVQDTRWAQHFGTVNREQSENYGKMISVHVWYSEGLEVEYGLTDETWCAVPIDEGTRRVISDGIQILTERTPILSRLITA
jgi:hypothetical protein